MAVLGLVRLSSMHSEKRSCTTPSCRHMSPWVSAIMHAKRTRAIPPDCEQRASCVLQGAGTVPQLIRRLYPSVRLKCWELDPAVVQAGRDHFNLQESDSLVGQSLVHVRQPVLSKC